MPITATLTVALLILGAVLALLGTAGFLGNWSSGADHGPRVPGPLALTACAGAPAGAAGLPRATDETERTTSR